LWGKRIPATCSTRDILAFNAEGGHLWPDADESTRTAVGAVIADRLA
jgi:hypothetical protein